MNDQKEHIDSIVHFYSQNLHRFEQFQASVETFFAKHPELNSRFVIHSLRSRLKDPDHLKDKIDRKIMQGRKITRENLFREVTDLLGVRVLHIYQDQFSYIHESILKHVSEGEWAFVEPPKAYTWDPELQARYNKLRIDCEVKDSFYTSVHYIVKPNNSNPNPICCEIQVRTLFDEIWSEIDHSINYPHPTDNIACKEQLRAMSKFVSAGSRLADSIYRTLLSSNEEEQENIQRRRRNDSF
jgi:ppGpp synthetase/RelA/SpoT-type nucleotidyltranferase